MLNPSDKKLRIPVRRVEGRWEVTFGGDVPVAEGQEAELVIPQKAITDKDFLAAFTRRSLIRILDRGTPLRVYLATKNLEGVDESRRRHLLNWPNWATEIAPDAIDNWSSGAISFFEVHVGPATERQRYDLETKDGGLWLETKGRKPAGLMSSTFELPEEVSEEPARSLNHAFTILSEVYEPWRISHTGSVYERFLYQESDGRWYPLALLRDASMATNDQQIAKKLWSDFMTRMSTLKKSRR